MSKRDSKSSQQWLIAVFGSPGLSLLFLAKTQVKKVNAHGTQQVTRGLVLLALGHGSISEAQVLYHPRF